MNVLVIEDEKITARDLIKTLKLVEPSVNIVGEVGTIEDALAFFATAESIDLIFSDIQLGDGLSFEIFKQVTVSAPIIFCTAFNEYALKAFETNSIDYVLKPFSTTSIAKAIAKYKTITKRSTNAQPDFNTLFETITAQIQTTKLSNIIVHQGERLIPISGEAIAIFFIESGAVKAVDFQGKKFVLNYNLEALESQFAPRFFRANRQFLINRSAVSEAVQHFNRKLLVQVNINFSDQILIGKEKTTAFMEWLAKY